VSSFVLLPLTLTLLEAGTSRTKGAADGKSGASAGGPASMGVVWKSLLGASRQPLVWAPLLGVAIALLKLPMPEVAIRSLDLIGSATSGVALFALGLVLSGQRLHVGAAVLVNAAFKMLAQPATMALLAVLLGVTGTYRREMILLGALPTASMTAMFAVEYEV
jgi:malonate transporter